MHLVESSAHRKNEASDFLGRSFSLAITDADSISALREAGSGRIALAAPFHMSEDDAYFILPDDIGTEIVDIMRDGDFDLLHEALRDGLLAVGQLERSNEGMQLVVERCLTPQQALKTGLHHTETIDLDGADPVRRINQLGHLQCTTLSAFMCDDGLEQVLRESEYLGTSWTLDPNLAKRLGHVDPTYVWSRHLGETAVSIELALFSEDDEIVVLLRPLLIAL